MRKAAWMLLMVAALCIAGLLLGSALSTIPRALGAELEPAMVVVLDRTAPWMQQSGLARLMPWDVIQVWFRQTEAETYIVTLETELAGVRSWQSVVVPRNTQIQAGCGFAFPAGVAGVEIKRIVILELPGLTVRDERWVK